MNNDYRAKVTTARAEVQGALYEYNALDETLRHIEQKRAEIQSRAKGLASKVDPFDDEAVLRLAGAERQLKLLDAHEAEQRKQQEQLAVKLHVAVSRAKQNALTPAIQGHIARLRDEIAAVLGPWGGNSVNAVGIAQALPAVQKPSARLQSTSAEMFRPRDASRVLLDLDAILEGRDASWVWTPEPAQADEEAEPEDEEERAAA